MVKKRIGIDISDVELTKCLVTAELILVTRSIIMTVTRFVPLDKLTHHVTL